MKINLNQINIKPLKSEIDKTFEVDHLKCVKHYCSSAGVAIFKNGAEIQWKNNRYLSIIYSNGDYIRFKESKDISEEYEVWFIQHSDGKCF